MNKIDFLVIGSQKCATTWLYECLKDHPQIHVPQDKKEVEYIGGDLYKAKGADWYFSLVGNAHAGQLKGDVSVEYIFNPFSAQLVKEMVPGIKLIASLRNPAERAISAYYWYLRKGHISAEKNIVEVFTQLKEAYLANKLDTPCIDIITRGLYDLQLQRYLDVFPAEQIMISYYDEISDSPLAALKKLYSFLGVTDDFVPPSLNARPKQNSYSKWLLGFERLNPKSRIIAKISNKLNQLFSKKSNNKSYSETEVAAFNIIQPLFVDSINSTRRIIESLPRANQPINTAKIENWKGKIV